MLFLLNKAKIISYAISLFTVAALLFIANNLITNDNSMQTSANIAKNYTNNFNNTNINSIVY